MPNVPYKKFTGYSPGVAVIGDHIVGVKNRDGYTDVRFCQQYTSARIFTKLEMNGIHIYSTYGLWLVFWRNCRYRESTLRAFLYPGQQMLRLSTTSRIKTFVFKYISVTAKWIRTSRTYMLNIYTENTAYARVFQQDFG